MASVKYFFLDKCTISVILDALRVVMADLSCRSASVERWKSTSQTSVFARFGENRLPVSGPNTKGGRRE